MTRTRWWGLLVVLVAGGASLWIVLERGAGSTRDRGDATRDARTDSENPAVHLRGTGQADDPSDEASTDETAGTDRPAPEPPAHWRYATVTGRIVGPDGRPVAEAQAHAVGSMSLYGGVRRYRIDPAAEDGRFVLHVMAGLATTVAVHAPGHAPVIGPRVLLDEGATKDVGTLRLDAGHSVRVRVQDTEGRPVPGLELYLSAERDPAPEGWEQTLEACALFATEPTDVEGRAVFDGLPAGTWRVVLTDEPEQVREHVEAGGEEVLFVVPVRAEPKTIRLQLKVLDPQGLPVPLVNVVLRAGETYMTGWLASASPQTFELDDVIGPATLLVYQPHDENEEPLPYGPVVVRNVGARESPVVIRMEAGALITGRVLWDGDPTTWKVTAGGRLDPNRDVCVPWEEAEDEWSSLDFEAIAGPDGTFCLMGLPPGRFHVGAQGAGRRVGPSPVVSAGASGVELTMGPVASLTIHLLPPKGLRFGNPYVNVGKWVDGGIESRGQWWGGGGDRPDLRIFEKQDVNPDARYRVRAWGTCSGIHCSEVVHPVVVPREEPYVIQLEEGPHVRGTVEREDGTPVWGAEVRYRRWPGGEFDPNRVTNGRWTGFAATDAAGAFDLQGLPADDVVLMVSRRGLTLRDPAPRVKPGASGVRLVVVPERKISGRVVDPAGGSLAGLRAAAVPARGRPVLWTRAWIHEDGFFEARGLAPGAYRILVWSRGEPADVRSVLSEPLSAGDRDVRLTLGRGGVLQGVVRSAKGRPISQAEVRLLGPWTNRADWTWKDGAYAFAGLPLGAPLELEVEAPNGARARHTVQIENTEAPTVLDVRLEPP